MVIARTFFAVMVVTRVMIAAMGLVHARTTGAASGAPRATSFTADATGRFPIEIHAPGAHDRTVLYVEVRPR